MRRLFFSVLILSSLMVGLDACKKGDQGPQGPAGPAGPTGPAGANGTAGATGAKGADGTQILSGATVPTATQGNVNDFYFNTATGVLYGPKTSAGWGTGTALKGANGNTGPTGPQGPAGPAGTNGTNGTNFLAGTGAPAATLGAIGDVYFDTQSSMIYPAKTAAGWGTPMAIGVTATPRTYFLEIDLKNGATTIGTAVQGYNDTTMVVDRAYVIQSSYTLNQTDIAQRINNYAQWRDSFAREVLFVNTPRAGVGNPGGNPYELMVPTQASDLDSAVGLQFIYTKDPKNKAFMDAVIAAGGPKYGLAGTPAGAVSVQPVQTFTFSPEDKQRLGSQITGTYNPLCYWMYAAADYNDANGAVIQAPVVGGYVDFYPQYKKVRVDLCVGQDWNISKTIDLNAAIPGWKSVKDSGNILMHFQYITPKGVTPNAAGLEYITRSAGSSAAPGTGTGLTTYAAGNSTGWASSATLPIQNFYNTWVSLIDHGAAGSPSDPGTAGGSGYTYGSGPANDYGQYSDGAKYNLTPPNYTWWMQLHTGTWVTYNMLNPHTMGASGNPANAAGYPDDGITLQNGLIKVQYRYYNGGSILRTGTAPYLVNWTGGIFQNPPHPWACNPQTFTGTYVPIMCRQDDKIMRLKIQLIPSSTYATLTMKGVDIKNPIAVKQALNLD